MKRNPWVISIVIGILIGSVSFFFWGTVASDLQSIIKLTVTTIVVVTLLVRLIIS